MENFLQKKCISVFNPPITNLIPFDTWCVEDVFKYVRNEDAKLSTETLRDIKDKKERQEFKAKNFKYITTSALMEKRTKDGLIRHSNILCIDIDDLPMCMVYSLRDLLTSDQTLGAVFIMISPSGKGLKLFILINTERWSHLDWFNAISNYIKETYQIDIDASGKDVGRACYLGHDASAIILNRECKLDVQSWLQKNNQSREEITSNPNEVDKIEELISEIEGRRIDLTTTYEDWIRIGFALASEYGESGRSYFHRVSQFHPDYDNDKTDKQYDRCLHSHSTGIRIATLYYMAKQNGIILINTSKSAKTSHEGFKGNEGEDMSLASFSEETINALPPFLRNLVGMAQNEEERNVILIGSIVTLSATFKRLWGNYDGSRIFPNLYLFLVAPASAGKGKLSMTKHLAFPIHNRYLTEYAEKEREFRALKQSKEDVDYSERPVRKLFFIPANSSSSSFYQSLKDSDECGMIFETEGDTLAQNLKQDYGNYSDGLRKAFHQEGIAFSRRKECEYVQIDCPKLSVLLSGTREQLQTLIPDAENGLLSRFLLFTMTLKVEWKNTFAHKGNLIEEEFKKAGIEYLKYFDHYNKKEIEFQFTEEQEKRFFDYFSPCQTNAHDRYGNEVIASVRRMGLSAFRIAMILSILQYTPEDELPDVIVCQDKDFENTLNIVSVLLKHTYRVLNMLPSVKSFDISDNKAFSAEKMLQQIESNTFTNQMAADVAIRNGRSAKTAERYLNELRKKGRIKTDRGTHTKL